MNGPHDLGGMHGFGPVPIETDEPVFHAAWERSVFTIMLGLAGQGHYNADHFRGARETIAPHRYLASRYYELWLHGVEQLLADRVPAAEIDAKVEQLRRDPRPLPRVEDPALAERLHRGLHDGVSTAGDAPAPRRFDVGDAVRTRPEHPPGHTRLPRYARDKAGVVEAVYPAFPLPDRADAGDYTPQHLYCVAFDARQLWGASGEPGVAVHLDMWEQYLLPAQQDGSLPSKEAAHAG